MSEGERIFSSKDVVIKKREFPLRPDGTRWFKVLGDTATIGRGEKSGLPNVSCQFESLDENAPKGRNFHTFILDTRPAGKDNAVMALGEQGIFALAQGLRRELQCHIRQVTVEKKDSSGNKTGETEVVDVYSPEDVKEFLLSVDGMQVEAREYIKKATEAEKKAYPNAKDRNVIGRWIIPEPAANEEDTGNVETPPVDAPSGEAPPPPRRGPPPPRRKAVEAASGE